MPKSFSAKSQGEWAEVCFLMRATSLGLTISQPFGDAKYDFILDNGRHLHRVQVKSVSVPDRCQAGCRISSGSGGGSRRPYTAREIDFLAACILPEDVWYILPVAAFAPVKTIRLCPDRRLRDRFAPFREAWELLLP